MDGSEKIKLNFKTFFVKVILPSFISVLLFVLLIFNFIIPFFRENMLNGKKEMIRELVNSTMGIANKYYLASEKGEISVEEAKVIATKEITSLRYGEFQKDYFWITDFSPKMIYHPYRIDLNGQDVSNFKDPKGNKMFVEMAKVVKRNGDGYVNYMWQWMDDSSRIVPKISYVKEFKQWDWIIGTGIYIEDVNEEISNITYTLTYVSLIITFVISLLLFIILRQFYKSEIDRLQVSSLLRISREKYKALVESSSEAKMMIIDKEIVHLNNRISELFSHNIISSFADNFNNLSADKHIIDGINEFLNTDSNEFQFESNVIDKNNKFVNAIITLNKIKFDEKKAYIITFKEISKQNHSVINNYTEIYLLIEDLKKDYIQLNTRNEDFFSLSIKNITREPIFCQLNTKLIFAINQMKFNKQDSIIILSDDNNPVGILTRNDILKLIPISEINQNKAVSEFMSAPLISINKDELSYFAIIEMSKNNIHHLPILDSNGNISGIITKEDIFNLIQSSEEFISYLISNSENLSSIFKEKNKSFIHLGVMIQSGANIKQLTKSITKISGLIQERIIKNIIKEIGEPPVNFSVIALGSEGRKEQSLISDQDNAIIYENSDYNQKVVADYFKLFAEKFNYYMFKTGYSYCPGEVMAKNPKWNKPLSTWNDYFGEWIKNATPENILDTEIFFDLRTVYGDSSFENKIKKNIKNYINSNPNFINILARHCITYKIPVNFFGNLQTENKGESHNLINIKNPIRVLVNLVRLYSIKHNLSCTNTSERIIRLFEIGAFSEDLAKDLDYAIGYLMFLQLKYQTDCFLKGIPISNYIDKNNLTSIEINTVKYIFSIISTLQTKIKFDYGINE